MGEWGGVAGHTVRFTTVSVSTVNYKLTLQATRGQRGTAPHPRTSLPLSLSLCLTQLCGFLCAHTRSSCVCVRVCVFPGDVLFTCEPKTRHAAKLTATHRKKRSKESEQGQAGTRETEEGRRERWSGVENEAWLRSNGHSQVAQQLLAK